MMIVPIWFFRCKGKKHHVLGNGYVDGSHRRGCGGTQIAAVAAAVASLSAIEEANTDCRSHIVMRERMQLNHQTFFKQDIPLLSKRIPFCAATFHVFIRTATQRHIHINIYMACMLTRNISLATNVLLLLLLLVIIFIVFLCAINLVFRGFRQMWRVWTGFEYSHFPNENVHACVRTLRKMLFMCSTFSFVSIRWWLNWVYTNKAFHERDM